jgi:hypothetical protein
MRYQVEALIKNEIEHVFGRSIVSSRDCIQLSTDVFQKTRCQLNPNTLRRFFGLVKATYPPSYSTLTILSKYCGFHSVEEVTSLRTKETEQHEAIDPENMLHFMVALFRDTPVTNENDPVFLSMVVNTLNFLNRHPFLAAPFQSQVAKTKNGQAFYFEQFVNIDKLNSYYGDGLRYYYTEKQTANAQVFAHSLLAFRYWLTGNDGLLKRHAEIVLQQPVSDDSIEPFIMGRYFATQIYLAHATQQPVEDIIIESYNYHSRQLRHGKKLLSFPRFELYLSEALVLTGHYEEALYYIQFANKNYSAEHEGTGSRKFLQNFYLLQAIALYQTNDQSTASALFDRINPADFYFLRKKFANILYLLLTEKLKRQHAKHGQQLALLLKETGYQRLHAIL